MFFSILSTFISSYIQLSIIFPSIFRYSKSINTKGDGWDGKGMRRIFEVPDMEDFPDKEEAQVVLEEDPSLLEKLPDREFDKQAVEEMR